MARYGAIFALPTCVRLAPSTCKRQHSGRRRCIWQHKLQAFLAVVAQAAMTQAIYRIRLGCCSLDAQWQGMQMHVASFGEAMLCPSQCLVICIRLMAHANTPAQSTAAANS